MREEKLKGEQVLEMEQDNIQWTVNQWDRWRLRNNCHLIIEDGKVVGYEENPVRYHK